MTYTKLSLVLLISIIIAFSAFEIGSRQQAECVETGYQTNGAYSSELHTRCEVASFAIVSKFGVVSAFISLMWMLLKIISSLTRGVPFLQPTTAKVLITVLFISLTFFIPKYDEICSPSPTVSGVYLTCNSVEVKGIGYPIFYGEYYSGDVGSIGFFPINFLANLVLYFTVSLLIVSIFNKLKSRLRNKF